MLGVQPRAALPPKLQDIVDDFSSMSREEKIETLLAYAESLPELPERLRAEFERMENVPECMTPVRLIAERQGDGSLVYHFDIPPESPTVRGLASILTNGLNGCQPEEILTLPADFYLPMKLEEAITPQRIAGFVGIVAQMKHIALRMLHNP